jgi:hypothetical protein
MTLRDRNRRKAWYGLASASQGGNASGFEFVAQAAPGNLRAGLARKWLNVDEGGTEDD